MTPVEFSLVMKAHGQSKEQEFDLVYWHAAVTSNPHRRNQDQLKPRQKKEKIDFTSGRDLVEEMRRRDASKKSRTEE